MLLWPGRRGATADQNVRIVCVFNTAVSYRRCRLLTSFTFQRFRPFTVELLLRYSTNTTVNLRSRLAAHKL